MGDAKAPQSRPQAIPLLDTPGEPEAPSAADLANLLAVALVAGGLCVLGRGFWLALERLL